MTPRRTLQAAALAVLLSSPARLGLAQDETPPLATNILLPPRWSVMTGTDPGAAQVNPKPVKTTVEKLGAMRRPATLPLKGPSLPIYHTLRVGAAERTLWSVDAHIVRAQLNPDGDYHLTLRSASGRQMTCELPDPKIMPHPSPFARQMMQARAALAARLHTTAAPQTCDVPARITGLGYYGRVRPGDGGPENGLQLHPVVSVSFPK